MMKTQTISFVPLSLSLFTAICALLTLSGCADARGDNETPAQDKRLAASDASRTDTYRPGGAFADYWYKGVAEVNRYQLQQARYGEIRQGDAVLIFVTEDFLAEKQVKLESEKGERLAPSVLKVNFSKKFITGLYPYSMMTSVFTPVDLATWPHSLKVTTSSQEWCGHTFTQVNWTDPGYRLRQFSYFEKEGDAEFSIAPDLLEDEVWTRLRIDPESLPVGRLNVLPGLMAARLQHTDNKPVEAEIKRESLPVDAEGKKMMRYTLTYTSPARTLMIDYRADFPHEIMGWSETYNDFGTPLTTKAVRTHLLRTDYWRQHGLKDTVLRKELGLSMGEGR